MWFWVNDTLTKIALPLENKALSTLANLSRFSNWIEADISVNQQSQVLEIPLHGDGEGCAAFLLDK